MNTLEERIQRLEDIEAIKDLTARYSFHINKGWNNKQVHVEAMPEIFAEDAVWESKAMKVKASGMQEIMQALKEGTEHTDFSMHSYTNPIIRVDGGHASGNWLFWIGSKRNGGPPNQVYMSEDITYTKAENGWRVKTVDVHYGMMLNEKP